MRGSLGSEHRSTTPSVSSFESTLLQVFPPSVVLKMPRLAVRAAFGSGSHRMPIPMELPPTTTTSGFCGSTTTAWISGTSCKPTFFQVWPASSDRYSPRPGRLLARSHVDHIGIGGSDGKSSDGGDALAVEDGSPNLSAVRRLPDTASRRAEIIGIRMTWHACYGGDSTAAKGADQPPLHGRERLAARCPERERDWLAQSKGLP